MYNKLLKTLFVSVCAFSAHAGEVKINAPLFAYHTSDRDDGGKWNENFVGKSVGASYISDKDQFGNMFGGSLNYTDKNSFGENHSIYATFDYQNEVYKDGPWAVNLGGHLGFATGYKEVSNSGRIPFVAGSAEIEFGNFSLMGMVTPSYKNTPVTFITLARFSAYKW